MTVEIGEDNQVASPQEEFSRDQSEQVCSECEAKRHCLGEGLSEEQMQGLRKITRTLGPFTPGENIFRVEDKFKSLFVIQSGAVKIETASFEGTKLVDGFFFRGDLVGMEAIGAQQYGHDAIALERTLVCELPFDHLESLCSFVPRLQRRLLIILGQKIRHTNDTIVHGRYMSAEKRLLFFLQMLCEKKIIEKNDNTGSVQLPMSKGDIASYLGLRPESLSRTLTKLQNDGIIRNHTKKIEFLDIKAILQQVCG